MEKKGIRQIDSDDDSIMIFGVGEVTESLAFYKYTAIRISTKLNFKTIE
jgi:hypothetical protein